MPSRTRQPGLIRPDSCGSPGRQTGPQPLPATPGKGKLDPDVVAFVEALARYAARKDHEAQSGATGES